MISAFLKNRSIKQFAILYSSTILSLIAALATSIVNTRLLGPQFYGDLKFIQTTLAIFLSLTTLGFIVSGSRLVATTGNNIDMRKLIAALFSLSIIITLFMGILLFFFSFIQGRIFNNQLDNYFRLILPLIFVFPFNYCVKNILQGANKITELSVLRVAPQIFYLIVVILWFYIFPKFSLLNAIYIQLICLSFCVLFFVFKLAPLFKQIKEKIFLILLENKRYGIHVYMGTLSNTVTQQLGVFAIAYYVGNIDVGFYSLAMVTASPLSQIPATLGIVLFRKFAKINVINLKIVIITIGISSVALVCYLLMIDEFFVFFYSDQFAEAVPLCYVIAFGSIFHGFGDFINRFLSAHGQGIALRNSAMAEGIVNVVGFVFFVYFWGPMGAAITKVVSGFCFMALLCGYYYKYSLKTKNNNP